MSAPRWYEDEHLKVQVRDLGEDASSPVKVHIEHKTGAALIDPECNPKRTGESLHLKTTGFDGTRFHVIVTEETVSIEASAPTPILGGEKRATIPRAEGPTPQQLGVRVTGHESTMPIPVKGGS